ncbi:uncharacterized protein LOC122647842, partial [Telopea speciosissima]|uniref:uncharacterized protein LOC122647842 n=1 Tax=Telopea speciosissima TaxID=54955 RepID=UPI001CC79ADF
MNIAGIMKQIWWIASKQDRLWVKWVQQRYLKQESLWTVKGLNNCSWVWRKVLKYRDKALPLIKTIIGDGAATKLWLDNWHPFGVLLNRFGSRICYDAGSYSLAARHACVKEIVRDGDWYPGPSTSFDLIDIWRALPTIEKFHDEVPDLTVWIGNSSGNFTSKSAWNAVRTRTAHTDWSEAVWFERGINSHCFIAWRCLSDALPTRDNLIHRHILAPHHCEFCWAGTESRNHLFFGCPFSTDIWKIIYELCFHDGTMPSNVIDAAISVRYAAGRAGKLGLVTKLALSSISLVGDPTTANLHIAAKWGLQVHWAARIPKACSWFAPNPNMVALHCDGSLADDKASFGGLIRDGCGDPIAAYAGLGEDLSVLSMEFKAIYKGISLCIEKGLYDVSVRLDSKLAVDILNGQITGPWQILILKSKILSKFRLLRSKELVHVWREQNQPADFMASLPTDPSGTYWELESFPLELTILIKKDKEL